MNTSTHLNEDYNKAIAEHLYFFLKEKPIYSTGICGNTTAGYGDVDWCGYFEYLLNVEEISLKVIRWGVCDVVYTQ